MYRKRAFVAAVVLVSFFSAVTSAAAQTDKVDEYVRAAMREQAIPGLSIAVVRNGELIYAQGYGVSNLELNAAATPETIYQSGSVGKQFTATLVMMLVEEGKLGLDDPISKYFAGAPAAWKDIKVRHLLTHTSGISNALYQHLNMRRDYTEDELVQQIAALPLDFQPGEKWSYSNPGYVMLGVLVHKVTGKFYGDVLREKIFGPLGMNTARIISEADIVPNRADGYRLENGEIKNQEWVSPMMNTTADGAIYLTVLDMAKWDAALYTEKLLKRSSLDQMWTPVKLNDGKTEAYGFGWEVGEVRGRRVLSHGGAWQGFKTHILRAVDDKVTVIVLANLAGARPGRITNGIARIYVPELVPPARKAVRIDPNVFDAYVGAYELGSGFAFTVSREGDRFWGQAPGQARDELFAESETTFFLKDSEVSFTFVRDASGKVTHLILTQGGSPRELKKVR